MGVKDLWTFLSPVYERKSLWALQGQTIAIDLSCWICDSQTKSCTVLRPYLRNLFFRTSCLLMLGVRPIFVLEGDAPDIKQLEIKRRIQATCRTASISNGKKLKRSRLNSMIAQCLQLLDALGVESIRSPGEGEALCAQLNAASIVDGCISQDSDCFLYGAKVVYRNFSVACSSKGGSSGFAVDAYDMTHIQERLNLDREGLVALALICGCDYQSDSNGGNRGVAGIGIEKASSLILMLSKLPGGVISRLKSWRTDTFFSHLEDEAAALERGSACILCGHRGNLGRHDRLGCKTCGQESGCKVNNPIPKRNSLLNMPVEQRVQLMMELSVRSKALANPDFPSQSIIDEFLSPEPHTVQLKRNDVSWAQPNLLSFLAFAETYLGWTREYSLMKFLPLLTRWKIIQGKAAIEKIYPHDVIPVSVKKGRVSKGVHCFEVEWKLTPGILKTTGFSTLEPCPLFEEVFPSLVKEFQDKRGKEKHAPKCGNATKVTRKSQKNKTNDKTCACSALERKKKGHICQYLIHNCGAKSNAKESAGLSSNVNCVAELLKDLDIQDCSSSFSDYDYNSDLDDEFDPLELSAIVKSIVGVTPISSKGRGKNEKIEYLDLAAEHFKSSRDIICMKNNKLDSSCNLSADEFDDVRPPFHLRVKSHLEKKADTRSLSVSVEDDVGALCNLLESAALDNVSAADELNGHNNSLSLNSKNSNIKDHLPEPNFDLGLSPLLRSPAKCKLNKMLREASP